MSWIPIESDDKIRNEIITISIQTKRHWIFIINKFFSSFFLFKYRFYNRFRVFFVIHKLIIMVNIAVLLNFVTTMFTFFEGVVEQVAPVVNKILDRKATRKVLLLYRKYSYYIYTSTISAIHKSKLSITSMWWSTILLSWWTIITNMFSKKIDSW